MTIHYFTCTGNSRRAALWVRDRCTERGVPSEALPIEIKDKHSASLFPRDGLLGIVQPAHGFTAPWAMIHFVLSLPRGKGRQALVVTTRAGTKIGSLFLPGMEGTANYLIVLLLLLKGYRPRGCRGVNMPSNWIAFHWGLKEENARAIIGRSHEKVITFLDRVLDGKLAFGSWIPFLIGLALAQVSLGYLLMFRFLHSKLFFAAPKCTSCGLCASSCPAKAIRMLGKKKPRPYWTYNCENCMRCMGFCPEGAIEASHPLAALMMFLTGIPVGVCLLNELAHLSPWFQAGNNAWSQFFVQYLFSLLSMFLVYWLVQGLLRIPAFSWLLTWTTPTHYFRRYKEPDTEIGDF